METFSGSGFVNFVGRVYLDNDGLIHDDFSANGHYTVTGDITGNQWVFNETARQQGIVSAPDSCGFSADFVTTQRIISRGAFENDFAVIRFHVEVDPDTCQVTFSQPSVTIDCRGR